MPIARIYVLGTREFFDRTQPVWLDIKDEGIPLDERVLKMPDEFPGQVAILKSQGEVREKLIKVKNTDPDFSQTVGPIPSTSGNGKTVYSTVSVHHPDLISILRKEVYGFTEVTE